MSRPGITYQEVANAAIQLQGKDEYPTVDRVREVLGMGSKSTIARYLKDWKSKTGHILSSDSIPHEIISIIKGLWERLRSESDNEVSKYKQETDTTIADIRQSLIQEQKHNNDLQTKNHQLEDQLHQVNHHLQQCNQQWEEEKQSNAKLTEQNERLNQQLTDQKAENERVHQLLLHVQNNLEHYQSSIQKLREEQMFNSEKQKSDYEHEINRLKQALFDSSKKTHDLQYKFSSSEAELNSLNQSNITLKAENFKLQNKSQENLIAIIDFKKKLDEFKQSHLVHQKMREEQVKTIIKLAMANQQIASLQKMYVDAEDTIHHLRDEKLFIFQEKFQLEGQIKLLEKTRKKHKESVI